LVPGVIQAVVGTVMVVSSVTVVVSGFSGTTYVPSVGHTVVYGVGPASGEAIRQININSKAIFTQLPRFATYQ
jgi:hypothetical protein